MTKLCPLGNFLRTPLLSSIDFIYFLWETFSYAYKKLCLNQLWNCKAILAFSPSSCSSKENSRTLTKQDISRHNNVLEFVIYLTAWRSLFRKSALPINVTTTQGTLLKVVRKSKILPKYFYIRDGVGDFETFASA